MTFPNNDCDAAPETSAWLMTTECNIFNDKGQWAMLASADCSVPPAPPLLIVAFADVLCTYGSGYPAGGPSASEARPWAMAVPATPASCLPGYWPNGVGAPFNNTRVSVSPAGAVSIYNYASTDAACAGPVFSSFVGLTYAPGNTMSAGTCTAASTGSFAQPHAGMGLGWARIAAAGAFTHGLKDAHCPAVGGGSSAGSAAAASSSSSVGPIVAGVVVAVAVIGAAAAVWYFRFSKPSVKEVVHGVNPAMASSV